MKIVDGKQHGLLYGMETASSCDAMTIHTREVPPGPRRRRLPVYWGIGLYCMSVFTSVLCFL